jgi:vacuolar-type H+-ATPase catalytic subunit A/Vma1
MKIRTLLIILFLCLCSVSCVNPAVKNSNGVKVIPTKNNDASEFLNFAEAFSNLSPEAQKQELIATNQTLVHNPNDLLHRMKLVMIYGLPSSNLLETPKAQNLLQQLLQENILANTQLSFAHLLFDYLVMINKEIKNNREDRKHVELLLQKNEALQLKLDAAQQKLEELKNIEKSMGERDIAPKK